MKSIKLALILVAFFVFPFFINTVSAQDAVPEPRVDCNQTRPTAWDSIINFFTGKSETEFHSLRPYQASPCNPEKEDLALYCGNDLILSDPITVSPSDGSCTFTSELSQHCTFSIQRVRDVTIELTGAKLPIMGNTENVRNSQTPPTDPGADVTGTFYCSPDPLESCVNNCNEGYETQCYYDYDKSVNGMIQCYEPMKSMKCFPKSDGDQISHVEKVNQYVSWYMNGVINRAEYEYLNEKNERDLRKIIELSGPLNKLLPWERQAIERMEEVNEAKDTRHDQIVGCVSLLGTPIACVRKFFIDKVFSPDRPPPRLTDWKKREPPYPIDYDNLPDYWLAYMEWRGRECFQLTIPLINKPVNLCGDVPWKPNYWSNLFPYIPLSSTEDRKGEAEITSATPQQGEVTVTNLVWSADPATLFFPHMEEADELGDTLQMTYISKQFAEENKNDVKWETSSENVEPPEFCDIGNARNNPGDTIVFDNQPSEDPNEIFIDDLSYTAEFECDIKGTEVYPGYIVWGDCTKTAVIAFDTTTKTPLADNVWGRYVAGEQSIFKRIYPRISTSEHPENTKVDEPVDKILDIPASTNIRYSSPDANITAGSPGGSRAGSAAEIYFPHIGGIQEYFLEGIQTALRPKGMGGSAVSGTPIDPGTIGNGTCEVGVGLCSVESLMPFLGNDIVKATKASIVCNGESGGSPTVINDSCLKCDDGIDNDGDGKIDLADDDCDSNDGNSYPGRATPDYSIGLFQYNILPSLNRCPGAWRLPKPEFTQLEKAIWCKVADQSILDACIAKYQDPQENIDQMLRLSNNGETFGHHWAVAKKCGIP